MNFELSNNHLELDISLTKASLNIVEMDRSDIELEFEELRKNSVEEMFEIDYEEGQLTIKEKTWRKHGIPTDFLNNSVKTNLSVLIPKGSKVRGTISTLSGNISANALSYNGRMKTVSGGIKLGVVESTRLRANSVVGGISIDYLKGAISSKVVSGSCVISDGEFKGISLSAVSGDITVNGAFSLNANGAINTVSGAINLNIKAYDSDYLLSLSTLSGVTNCEGDYPSEKVEIKKRISFLKNNPLKGVMPDIKGFFSSFSRMMDDSDIEIKTQAQEQTETHVKSILDMVAEGKITVDEAEKLIKAIKG